MRNEDFRKAPNKQAIPPLHRHGQLLGLRLWLQALKPMNESSQPEQHGQAYLGVTGQITHCRTPSTPSDPNSVRYITSRFLILLGQSGSTWHAALLWAGATLPSFPPSISIIHTSIQTHIHSATYPFIHSFIHLFIPLHSPVTQTTADTCPCTRPQAERAPIPSEA